MDKGYIYIRNHLAYDVMNACKMGKASNIPERDSQYATGEINRGYFILVLEVLHKTMGSIERLLQNKFKYLNIKYNAGTEFYNKDIIQLIEPYLDEEKIKYRKLSEKEINKLIRSYRVKKTIKKINIKSLVETIYKIGIQKQRQTNHIWNERQYQRTIIDYSKNALLNYNKIYIELPTGGGKSYIVYNLLEHLNSTFIIIISPRKIVNTQNVSQKYLQILNNEYIVFNYSNDTGIEEFLQNTKRKILICCTQTIDKIYEKIILQNNSNITVWFDEAHWGIEDRAKKIKNDTSSIFWLLDNEYIKYRIYTSASPDKELISQYEDVFGTLYSYIKVKDLIELKWLSNIKAYIYSDNIENVDNIKYMIDDFNEKHRKYGFSFHNKQQNAFNLFYRHYHYYKENKTCVKPYLLVGNNFNIEIEPRLNEIQLDYDYRNITNYENSEYSIGYVVAKYSMGYDFNKIDYICLSDPKLSIQDIIQCIGRGIRPDQLGPYGSNKEKIIIISLPVYIDEEDNNKYQKIIEVLKYLLYNIEIPYEEIEFIERCTSNNKNKSNTSNDYTGENSIKSMLLNLLELNNIATNNNISYEKIRKILIEKNIKSKEEYYLLCDSDKQIPREPDIIFKGRFTNWIDYLNIDRIYYDLDTCMRKIEHYLGEYPEIKRDYLDLNNVCKKLCNIDGLFPPYGLWVEYYNKNTLSDIINIPIKTNKKKRGVLI